VPGPASGRGYDHRRARFENQRVRPAERDVAQSHRSGTETWPRSGAPDAAQPVDVRRHVGDEVDGERVQEPAELEAVEDSRGLPGEKLYGRLARSLDRATSIFAACDQDTTHLSFAELARRTDMPRSRVHRLASELIRLGWLEQLDGEVRGIRLFELGLLVPRRRGIAEAARPFMEDLRQATGFAVHLAALDGIEVVYLEILHPKSGLKMASRIGGRLPSHATGVGKAQLAYHPAETTARIEAG
jgi:IclR-like helix-turn-helix domain-containing protein